MSSERPQTHERDPMTRSPETVFAGVQADPTLGSAARGMLAIAVFAVKCGMIPALTLEVLMF